jgi:hypothetical protein
MAAGDEQQAIIGLSNLSNLSYQVGKGEVQPEADALRLTLFENDGRSYSDAQVDDYHVDGTMRWRPPLTMTASARFSHPQRGLTGTAGFGFWNDPFGMTKIGGGTRWLPRLRLPQALWFFFASPPSDMALAMGVPGNGWKAATINASTLLAKMLLPVAPLGMVACRMPWGYRRVWPLAQRVLKIDESLLPVAMDAWHDYRLEWRASGVRFVVDGEEVFQTRYSPRGPLGFVAWVDNQYMVATPQGRLRNGLTATGEQWMEISALEVKAG